MRAQQDFDRTIPKLMVFVTSFLLLIITSSLAHAQDTKTLEQILKAVELDVIVEQARLRGNPERGALVYYTASAGCIKCHGDDSVSQPLGPNLHALQQKHGKQPTDRYLVESLLSPSKSILKGYETLTIVTESGKVSSGLFVREDDKTVVLRDAANLEKEIEIPVEEILDRVTSDQSMMPEGLVSTLPSLGDFYDLLSYVFAISEGGPRLAVELKPSAEQLEIKDDISNLDHAGILKRVEKNRKSLSSGREIFNGLCASCHGVDGNKPSLATARAFGTQKLKYGADPYHMFLTLSRGNGLMGAATYLSPKERYEVIAYVREQFMKGKNPDYLEITDDYLASLPTGTEAGEFKPAGPRDYGPALASQLGQEIRSALTVKLNSLTISYNLHTLETADVWRGGFLKLDQTQHYRGRGEGYPSPDGKKVQELSGWRWAHEGQFDYSPDDVLPRGPLPLKWLDYHGHYVHGDKIVLSYDIDGRAILECPQQIEDENAIRRCLKIGPGTELQVITAEGKNTTTRVLGDLEGVKLSQERNRWILRIPASRQSRILEVLTAVEDGSSTRTKLDEITFSGLDPEALTHGGPTLWPDVLSVVGYPGLESTAYVLDTISVPEKTPWNSWLRTSGIDFFADGRMAVSTVGGDVWIVEGVDQNLLNLRWKRFAGGMFELFGIKVVDNQIYVTGRDRITRLHDLNDDGEADFYESFFPDPDVSTYFHAFNFDLQRDNAGNFYYAKSGQYTDFALPGALMRVSADGKSSSVVATGFRTPNGLGMMPGGQVTVSDNQGNWMPASKVSLIKEGGFYGYVQTHSGGKKWSPDGGRINAKEVIAPETFDQPLIWFPQELDNSSGGQIWVDDPRWGPLSNHLLHTSFGKGWMYYLMIQEVDGISQAAAVRFPMDFNTGIMRGRVNPVDGQVYAVGLNGWNDNGRLGLKDHGIQRVRYTQKPLRAVTDARVEQDELRVRFSFPLDPLATRNVSSYQVSQWNYQWTRNYGSPKIHPETGQEGIQEVEIAQATVSSDRRELRLRIPGLKPVDQLQLKLKVVDENGVAFEEDVLWTIHRIPASETK